MNVYYTMTDEIKNKFQLIFNCLVKKYESKYDEVHFEIDEDENKCSVNLSINGILKDSFDIRVKNKPV